MTKMTRDEILADPAAATKALESLKEAAKSPLPVADLPPSDLVRLPGGLMHKGQLIRTVIVRELNGEDEEALARAIQSTNGHHFYETLLKRGTERLGDLDEEESQRLLPDLLTGDRDEILLGVRAATYGNKVEVFNWVCPKCMRTVDKLTFDIGEDIKRTRLKEPAAESMFEVSLRRGASAKVRLETGRVRAAALEDPDLLAPQRDDIILAKTIETYTDAQGSTHLIPGFPSMVRKLSAPDRRAILTELAKRQPGPRYNEITFEHDGCGEEVALALGITDFFRDLIAGLV